MNRPYSHTYRYRNRTDRQCRHSAPDVPGHATHCKWSEHVSHRRTGWSSKTCPEPLWCHEHRRVHSTPPAMSPAAVHCSVPHYKRPDSAQKQCDAMWKAILFYSMKNTNRCWLITALYASIIRHQMLTSLLFAFNFFLFRLRYHFTDFDCRRFTYLVGPTLCMLLSSVLITPIHG